MANILIVVHVLAAVAIIVLVLMQQGRGADMGAAFGGGGSQTLFGARGSSNFLSKITAALAATFFLTSMTLAYIYAGGGREQSVTEEVVVQPVAPSSDIPAVPESDQGTAPDAPVDVPAAPEAAGDSAPKSEGG